MNDFPSEWDIMDFRTHFRKRHLGQFSSINQARRNFFQKRSGEKTIREERVNILEQKVFQLWLCTLLLLRQFFQFQYQDAQTFLISTFSICWFGFSTHDFILYEWNFWGILKNNAIQAFPVEFMCVKYSKVVKKKKVFLQTKCWWQDRETENKWLRMWGDHTGNDNTIKSLNLKKWNNISVTLSAINCVHFTGSFLHGNLWVYRSSHWHEHIRQTRPILRMVLAKNNHFWDFFVCHHDVLKMALSAEKRLVATVCWFDKK